MQVTVREATTADAAIIADLSRQTFYDTFIADNKPEDMDKFMNEQFTHDALVKEVGAPGNYFLLAHAGDALAGYARLRENTHAAFGAAPAMEIARIYATQQMIGKGIGKQLMLAAIQLATTHHKQVIWLGVWEKNQRAIRFYQQFGFEKFSEHAFVLGNDVQTDWLMKKQIA